MRIADCISVIKRNTLLSILEENCGSVAARIWRLLYDKKKLDERQITKLALMQEKVARELLYKMLKLGMVFIQVSKTETGCPEIA